MQRAAFDLVGTRPRCERPAPLAATRELAGRIVSAAQGFRRDARRSPPARRPVRVRARRGRRRARNSRRARCTPAHRAGTFPLLRWSARGCCGSRSAWATRTRASRSGSSRCRSRDGARLAGRVSGDCDGGVRVGLRAGGRSARRRRDPAAARAVVARAAARTRASRQSPRGPGLSRQRRRIRVRPRAVLAAQGRRAPGEPALVRSPLPDGLRSCPAAWRRTSMRSTPPRSPRRCGRLAREITTLRGIYDEHAGLQDRFSGLRRRHAGRSRAQLGLVGLAGRASGQAFDLRCDFAGAPYDALDVRMATPERRRRRPRRRAVRRAERIAAPDPRDRRRPSCIRPHRRGPRPAFARLALPDRPRPRRRLARTGAGRARRRAPRARSAAAIRTIRRGRTGRCSSTPSSATSFPTSR